MKSVQTEVDDTSHDRGTDIVVSVELLIHDAEEVIDPGTLFKSTLCIFDKIEGISSLMSSVGVGVGGGIEVV